MQDELKGCGQTQKSNSSFINGNALDLKSTFDMKIICTLYVL